MTSPAQQQIINSRGANVSQLKVPQNSCDSHIHIYDSLFPYVGEFIDGATVNEYRAFQKRIGTTRAVVVNPRICGTDNRVTLDAIERLGVANTRGIAVITPNISEAELSKLNDGGIRGVRFTLFSGVNAPTSFDMVEPVAQKVKEFGWHLQLHWTADQIVEHEQLIKRLMVPLVFDHIARIPVSAGVNHPALIIVSNLLQEERAWLKLSGAYLDSKVGQTQNYSDLNDVAKAFVKAAPDRLVWGSDWPHPTEKLSKEKPNDAQLMDLLISWVGDQNIIERILVTNPKKLYQFS